MAKSYQDKGYWGKQDYLKEQAERYGIDLSEYEVLGNNSGKEGLGGDLKSQQDLENAIARSAANDYDVRESIAAGKATGSKHYKDLGDGISNIDEVFAANRAMKKTHKNAMGNTGNFSSANDYGNVTAYMQQKSTDQMMEDIKNDVLGSMEDKGDKDKDKEDEYTHVGSFNDFHNGASLAEVTAKATSGFNADGTPAQVAADELLASKMSEVAGDKDKMEQGKFRQGKYVLDNLNASTFGGM